jgi:hypothetical protein
VVAHFDRARALEAAWERAWARHAKVDAQRFAQPFDLLWHGKTEHWMPALLLNATVVETGKRLIVSNLRLTADEFSDVEDVNRFYGDRALPLSAAAHLSARFTYVSPAGTLKKDGTVYGRAVDGGYFENSGSTAALEIIQSVDQMKEACGERRDCFWNMVDPVMILISNEPVDRVHFNVGLSTPSDKKDNASQPSPCCNEVWSPLRTLFATRGARGTYARDTAHWHLSDAYFLRFGLCKDTEAKIPLGWVLSDVVQNEMNQQLTRKRCASANASDPPIIDNPGNLARIEAMLRR